MRKFSRNQVIDTPLHEAVKSWACRRSPQSDPVAALLHWNQYKSSDQISANDKERYDEFIRASRDSDIIILNGDRGEMTVAAAVMMSKLSSSSSESRPIKRIDKFVVVVDSAADGGKAKETLIKIFPGITVSQYTPALYGALDLLNESSEPMPIDPDANGLIVLPQTAIKIMLASHASYVGSFIIDYDKMNLTEYPVMAKLVQVVEDDMKMVIVRGRSYQPVHTHLGRLIMCSSNTESSLMHWDKQISSLRTELIVSQHVAHEKQMSAVNEWETTGRGEASDHSN